MLPLLGMTLTIASPAHFSELAIRAIKSPAHTMTEQGPHVDLAASISLCGA
jgi:hypothetical protein